jgi:hypothetical protein
VHLILFYNCFSVSNARAGVLDRSLNVRDAHTLHRRIEERQRLKEMKLDTQRRTKEVEEVGAQEIN